MYLSVRRNDQKDDHCISSWKAADVRQIGPLHRLCMTRSSASCGSHVFGPYGLTLPLSICFPLCHHHLLPLFCCFFFLSDESSCRHRVPLPLSLPGRSVVSAVVLQRTYREQSLILPAPAFLTQCLSWLWAKLLRLCHWFGTQRLSCTSYSEEHLIVSWL